MSNPKVGDYPVRFTCNLGTDISLATVKQINFKKANGATLGPKTAEWTNDGTDGLIYYDTISGDLDGAGEWQIEPYIEDAGPTFEYRGQTASFTVDAAVS